jgi:hypothetical protein
MVGDPIPERITGQVWRIRCNHTNCDAEFTAREKANVEAQFRTHEAAKHPRVSKLLSEPSKKMAKITA